MEKTFEFESWRDFATKMVENHPDKILNINDDHENRMKKTHFLMTKLSLINPGTPWIAPQKSVIDDFDWIEDLHLCYLESDISYEDYNEYQYHNNCHQQS